MKLDLLEPILAVIIIGLPVIMKYTCRYNCGYEALFL